MEDEANVSMNVKAEIKFPEPKKTGELMFQFDDDEPKIIGDVFDHGKITITLQQKQPHILKSESNNAWIKFENGNRKFRLFIQDIFD